MSSSEVNIYLFFYWKMTNFDDRCTSFIVARFKALFHSLFFFFFQYADSDDEHDGMMDTDEEVTNGRVMLFNGNGPPYFHGYLYMKGVFL